ncbi:MAG: DinB family protein [Sphingobacteriales bacterium]|jgi:uncharacterized damage-inducible protein DinB|nr:DinB family protein [Sphingobacteriales bacterium]
MSSIIQSIMTLLSETATGNNWTGINTETALRGITAEQAVRRLNANHLNIAELAAHLTCWNKVIARRLNGENYQPGKEEDFPVINLLLETEWEALKTAFMESFVILETTLNSKEDNILNNPIFEGGTSAYRNLHGQISHLHYHMGQIVLLKKLL